MKPKFPPKILRKLGDMILIQKDTHLFEIKITNKLSIFFSCIDVAKKVMLSLFYGSIDANNNDHLK